jgi:hypothetical protein
MAVTDPRPVDVVFRVGGGCRKRSCRLEKHHDRPAEEKPMMTEPCSECRKLEPLSCIAPRVDRRVTDFRLEALDRGNTVEVFAAQTYERLEFLADQRPAHLDVEHARRLRDWLTAWLERQS